MWRFDLRLDRRRRKEVGPRTRKPFPSGSLSCVKFSQGFRVFAQRQSTHEGDSEMTWWMQHPEYHTCTGSSANVVGPVSVRSCAIPRKEASRENKAGLYWQAKSPSRSSSREVSAKATFRIERKQGPSVKASRQPVVRVSVCTVDGPGGLYSSARIWCAELRSFGRCCRGVRGTVRLSRC